MIFFFKTIGEVEMYNNVEIADRIKLMANLRGINIKSLLLQAACSATLLSDLKRNHNISSITLARIADILNCSVDYLLGHSNDIGQIYISPDMKQ